MAATQMRLSRLWIFARVAVLLILSLKRGK
jgi:hypothetical protein